MNKLSITLALTLALMLAGNASAKQNNNHGKECDKYEIDEKERLIIKSEKPIDVNTKEAQDSIKKDVNYALNNCKERIKNHKKPGKRKQAKK